MPVEHIVLFRWQPGTAPDQINSVLNAILQFKDEIPGVEEEGTNWKNEVTLLSQDMFMEYEPRAFIGQISPTPLLMIVGDHDHRCLTDVQLTAFNAASEPKRLVLLDAGHYEPYTTKFEEASSAARDWFVEHLIDKSKNSVP